MILKTVFVALAAVAALAVAYYLISPAFIVIEADEASPISTEVPAVTAPAGPQKTAGGVGEQSSTEQPSIVASGAFTSHEHEVAGRALLIDDDKQIVRFEDFETVNGPDLHIYLSADLDAKEYVDLGAIKATKGNVNYDVPVGTDIEKFKYVLVWCEPFRVLFGYAELE